MSSRNAGEAPGTRRERRAAARRDAPRGGAGKGGRKASSPWRSPVALITGGVLVAAVVAVVALQLLPGSGHSGPAAPGTRSAAGIFVPAVGIPTDLASGRSLGRADAPVHLTVWSDFQCPACKAFAEGTEWRLVAEFVRVGTLRIDYRDLTIIGPESTDAAAAARCADQQDMFWPYHDVLFANQPAENSGALTPQRFKDMADAVGLDRPAFDACLPSSDLRAAVQAEVAEGHTRANATPTLDFGTEVIPGVPAYEQLKATIERLAAAATAAGSGSGVTARLQMTGPGAPAAVTAAIP